MNLKMNKEIQIELIEISGFVSALKALRLPFGRECRSRGYVNFDQWYSNNNHIEISGDIDIDEKDLTLMSTLIKRGDEHAKVIRGINVYLEINAPRYIWQEIDPYRIGTDRLSSESTMHIQGQGMSEDELVEMKSNLTEGTMQKRIQMFSYQTLRRIYFQRKDHRLPQWRQFCKFIEGLPFSEQLITIK